MPGFLPGPDGSDPLFVTVAAFTIGLIVLIGALYFTLHALPERMAHHGNSTQMQVIGILALLALFTHNHIFWIAALLVAAFRMPDFLTPLQSISDSLMAIYSRMPVAQARSEPAPPPRPASPPDLRPVEGSPRGGDTPDGEPRDV
ncbi:hypothetical protein AB9K41_05595 [Cribrihabitans sp. XS_ASV171]